MNINKWLELNSDIRPSTISEDTGRCYHSKIDGSYLGRVDMEDSLEFLAEHELTRVQNYHGDGSCSANIGFKEGSGKWFGWSHRAFCGFGIGSEVKKGDCAYSPSGVNDFLEDMIRFWSDEDSLNVMGKHTTDEHGVKGVEVSWVTSDRVPNRNMHGRMSKSFTPYPDKYGHGSWTALTLDDARQMACDFAEGVS